ncbi:MAG: response regulator [Proteobacteria bacterium]|nr:response regulator [Pseudomonadota bacterium]
MTAAHPLRVLVVKDDKTSSTLTRRVLEARGHEVTVCETAEHALEAHERRPHALMIVDWQLPEMDGVEFCRQIRRQPTNADIVILMMTGRAATEDLTTILEAGASDFLAKSPDQLAHLSTRIAVLERTVAERGRRRQAETALAVSKAEFETIYRSIPDAVVFTDTNNRIVRVNPAFTGMFGYQSAEVVGRALGEVTTRGRVLHGRFDEAADPGTQSASIQTKAGAEVLAELTQTDVRDSDGRLSGHLTIYRDVTHRKMLEARLQVADRMASMGTLAAGVAHEINNPLTFIMGNLNFLGSELRDIAGPEPSPRMSELHQTVHEALEGSERVRRIVRQLKTFARGGDEVVGPVDVHEILEKTLTLAKNNIRHRAQLVRDYGEIPRVVSDPTKLGQVFLNLLVNAAEALPLGRAPDHLIRVTTALSDDGRVMVSVSDSGSGVPPDVAAKIFDPFYTTKPVGEGTGLGLAICHGIVTQLQGEIRLESEPGRGATFTVLLPVAA